MTRTRYTQMTVGAGLIAAVVAVAFLGAPLIPAAGGTATGIVILLWRGSIE
ncbi:MAG: hypothetical protein ACREQF_06350 [Candidatus Binataceae bacterium]